MTDAQETDKSEWWEGYNAAVDKDERRKQALSLAVSLFRERGDLTVTADSILRHAWRFEDFLNGNYAPAAR